MRPVEREASLEFDSIGLFIVDDQEGAIPWGNILFISKALSSDVGVLGGRGVIAKQDARDQRLDQTFSGVRAGSQSWSSPRLPHRELREFDCKERRNRRGL